MKWTSTLPGNSKKSAIVFISLILITLLNAKSYAQSRTYANEVTIGDHVDNKNNALSNDNTFARVNSSAGLLLGAGAYQGELELKFPAAVPAGTTAYIRINVANPDLLNTLLGGNLGGALADVLGTVVLGNRYFDAGARMGSGTSNTVLHETSANTFSNSNIRLIKDASGYFYVAITPNVSYDRVYLKDYTNAILGLGASSHTDVYNAFYGSGTDPCAQAFATGYEGTGLTVDLLGLGKAGVTNAERAIDADPNNFSQISLGALGVAGTMSQNIYFETLSGPGDDFNVKIKVNPALLNAGLLNNTSVTAYNGTTQVYTQSLSSLLDLDLLGLLNSGEVTSIPFSPGLPFNRVKITISSLLNASLTQTISLYAITRSAGRPGFTAPASNTVAICSGNTASLTATTAAANELRWYSSLTGGTPLATVPHDGVYTTPALTANKVYYVAARKIGCTEESARVPVTVNVTPIPVAPTLAPVAPVCSGSAAVLTINNPGAGITYRWYADATGGTALATGNTYNTGALTASKTFYAEAASGTCISTARTAVTVTVNALPALPQITTNNETISSGQTATLHATAETGSTIEWFANATGGMPLGTGEAFTTPKLTATTIYYAGTKNASGCTSESRVPVTVTVINGTPNPSCNAAVSQQTGIDGICLLCSIQGAGNSTDANLDNFTKINLVVGVGATGYQRLIFANPGTATDSIRLDLETPTGLADVSVLGGATIRVMNGTSVVKTYQLNSSLLDLKLLSGNRFTATVVAGGVYDRVEIRFGALVSALTNLSIYGAEIIYPNPTVAATGLAVCSGSSTTLSAVANGGTTLKWYSSPTSNTVLATGATFTTPVLTTNTTYYIAVSKGTCVNAERVPVTVTVTSVPAAPLAATVAPICSGSTASLAVNTPQTGVTYRWYAAATGGAILATGATYTTPSLTTGKTYYVEAASGTCVSTSRTAVVVTVNPLPAAATVTTNNAAISSGQTAVLTATATSGATINWYAGPAGGAILATGPTFTTPSLTATTTYYIETVNATGCVSATRVPVTVTVTGGPVNPYCNAANKQQSGINGICLLCTIQNAGNSVDDNFTNYTTITLPVGVGGSGYQRLIFSEAGTGTDSIRLNLETPTGLADVTVLGGIQVRVMNGSSVVKTFSLTSSLLNLRLLSGNRFTATLPAGGVYDRVEVRANGLVSALINLRVYGAEIIYPNPTVSAAGQTICSGNATMLSAAANGGTTLRWYSAATGGTLLETGENFTTPVLTANTTYYIEVSKGSCANVQRIPVKVTVTSAPAAPVIAAVPPVCSGSSVSIPVSSPVAGATYRWYTSATGGTLLFTGPVFTATALTANTTYYVEMANGSCVSASRTAVAVTVNPLPALPHVQASATTVNAGQTVVLTATSTDANVTFNWYTSTGSNVPVFTGPTYVTPPLTANTTYYLGVTSNTTGCSAPSRAQVTINVNGGGNPNPVPCEAPTAEIHGVNGIALLAGVFNAQLAIDDDTKTASSLVMPVGLLGASVYQRIGFSTLSNIGDTVRVLLSAPGKLLSLGVLSNIKVGTYHNNISNNDGLLLNNALIHLELLSGDSEALISFVPTKQFDQIEVSLNSGVAGALTTVDLNYAQRVLVAPEVVSADVTTCATQTATLTVKNPKTGITYKWYNAAGLYQTGKDGITFVTPALTASTTYFVEANTASGCKSYRTPVNVTVTPLPQTPVLVSPTVNTCSGNTVVLEVSNPLTGITYKWYNSGGVYQAGKDGVKFTVANVTGAVNYSVEAVNTCGIASSKATATINVGTIDIPVVTPASVTVRSGSPAVLTATSSSSGAVFNWYASSSSSAPILFTGSRYTTDPLINNGTAPTTITFYVEAMVPGGCPASGRASVAVTVIPNGTPTDVPCEAATVQVRSGVDGVALLTGVFNPQLAVDNNSESASSFVMPVGILGASVYQQVGFNDLSTIGDTVRIRISSPGKLLSLAVLPSIELTTFKGSVSNNDMIVASNPLIHLELLSDNSGAVLTFVPQKQFDGVELRLRSGLAAVLTTLDFNYAQRILVAPVVQSATASACVGSSATLAVKNPATGITYRWYKGTTYLTGKDGSTLTTDPTLTAGVYDYFVSASRNGCESTKTKVVVTILAAPDAPVAAAGNPLTTCPGTSATLSVNPVAGVSFNWYDALTGGNLLATNTNTYATPASLAVGVHNFYIEAVNGNSCTNITARTKITLTVNPTALASDINVSGTAAPFCAGATPTLTASSTTVTSPVFTWYSDAALTNAVFTGAAFKAPALTATTTYYVTVRGANKCENTAADAKVVTLKVNPPATAADLSVAGAGSPFCAGTEATLTASSTTVTSPVFTWYSDAALTDAVFTGAAFKTPALTATITYYVTVRGSNKCENLAANAEIVTLTVNPPSLASDIHVTGAGSPFCSGNKATLTASSTTVTSPVFTWYSDAALTSAVFTGPVFVTPALTATKTYYVTVRGANKCENTAANAFVVTLTVNPPALASDINVTGAGSPFCAGSKATLTATSTTVTSPVFTWYSDAALTDAVFTGPVFVTPALTATKTYYVTVRGANKCENTAATAKTVTVTVNPPALASDISVSGAGSPFCKGSTAKLTASSTTVTSPVFTWYSDAALTDAVFTGPIFNTPVLTATKTYYVTVRGANKCENVAGTAKVITLTVNPPALASDISVAGASSPFCAGTEATLTASSTTVTSPVFTWYTDAALSNAVFTGPVFKTPALTTTTTYYVTVRGANKCENTAGNAKVVTLTVNPPALASDISVTGGGTPICAGNGVMLTASSTTVTTPVFTWYTDAALTNAVFTGAVFNTGNLNATATFYVTVRGSNKCENTAATAKTVTITVNPLPNVPVVASSGTNICSGEATVLTIQNAQTGIQYEWYSGATGGTPLFKGTQYTTAILNSNTDFYVLAVSASGCGNATGRIKVTVTVTPKPVAPAVVLATVNACIGSTAALSISNPQAGLTYRWYADPTGGTALGSGEDFTTPVITATTIFYAEASNASCTSMTRTAVTVNASSAPVAPISVSGAADPLCSGSATILSVDNPDASLTYRWYDVQTGGTALAEGNSFTTPALTATTTFFVESVNTATGCTSAARTSVVVTVLSKLDAPVVSVQSATATSITFEWNAVPGATAYEVSLDNGLTWLAPSAGAAGTTYLVSGLKPDQSVTIKVRAKGQLDCQLSDATTLTAKSDNPLGNTIFVPNTFTPNNDGNNDILYVYGNTIAKMKLRIYNQWGQFIYESLNIQNGWDGTYKGELQPNGVYVYLLEAEFNDGTKTTKKGTITLLR